MRQPPCVVPRYHPRKDRFRATFTHPLTNEYVLLFLFVLFTPSNGFLSDLKIPDCRCTGTTLLLSAEAPQKKEAPKKKKRRKSPSQKMQSKRNQGSKQNFDAMLKNMGLEPASNVKQQRQTTNVTDSSKPTPAEVHVPVDKISLQTQLDYAQNGHAAIRSFFNPSMIKGIKIDLLAYADERNLEAWRQKVEVASNSPILARTCTTIDECRDHLERLDIHWDKLPFLQHFNTWRSVDSVKQLALSPSLGKAAALLLNVPSVRLYQDALFCKRSNDGPTPWHTDARMAPFDTSNMITFWIPLQPVLPKGTALVFVSKSHSDFALPFWNKFDGPEYSRLEERYRGDSMHHMPLDLGDATVHSGWTLHCADSNPSNHDRHALAITYVDSEAQVRETAGTPHTNTGGGDGGGYGDNEDQWSYKEWVAEVPVRQTFRHPLVPIVWPTSN